MKKTAALLLAAMTVLTGCGGKSASQSESSAVSDSTSAADSAARDGDIVLTIGVVNGDPGNMNANGSVTKIYFWTPMQELVDAPVPLCADVLRLAYQRPRSVRYRY